MAAIKLTGFQGLYPRTAERLLTDLAAQKAENVNLTSGEIRPIKYPLLITQATNALTAYRAVSLSGEKWRTWTKDVNVAKGALAADVESRYYWTGDGEPRWATYTDFGTTDYALGIPNPTTAVSVSHSGGTGSAVTRFYRYTFVSQNGEESGPSPVSAEVTGKIDGTWNIGGTTAMQAFPANSGTFTGVFGSGSTVCTAAATHWLRVGDEVVINSVTLSVTAISGLTFTVAGNYSAYTTWARKAYWNTTGMYRRLYRTSGSTGQYQLVADNITGTTYSDTLLDSAIEGDEILSDTWEPPPAGLKGLGILPSGAMYGFVNNLLCFSEPFQGHAWPTSYQLACDHSIVATESFGTVVVAATASSPYMADGIDPASATMNKVSVIWPCLSKRSMCAVGDAVVYATSSGLAMIGQSGPSIFTQNFYTEAEWKALDPSSMVTELSEGRLFIRYKPTASSSAMLVFKMQEQATLTTASVQADALYTDPTDGELYVIDTSGVSRYDSDTGLGIPWTWESKEIELPNPTNWGAARVELRPRPTPAEIQAEADRYAAAVIENQATLAAYTGRGGVNGLQINGGYVAEGADLIDLDRATVESVTFVLVADNNVIFTKTMTNSETFRLPSGYLPHTFSVRLSGNTRLMNVKIAETMDGLRAV